jgi:polyisoprenyl-teichoic acid--peptidoglycan teichoic acid transferase
MPSAIKPPLPTESTQDDMPNSPLTFNSPRKPRIAGFFRFLGTVVLGILFGSTLFLAWLTFATTEEQRQNLFAPLYETQNIVQSITGLQTPTSLLVMGVDMPGRRGGDPYEGVRSDTMMLVKMDPGAKTISVISVPRDSRVQLARGKGVDKINAAFAYGGPTLAKETVEQNFGLTLDHMVVINTAGVRDVIDAMGGIDVYIDKPMRYKDYTAKLFIDFQPGYHHLNGSQAEGFLRFRHDPLGDIGRVRRQQVFISAVLRRLKDPTVWLSVPNIINVGMKYVITDLSTSDLIAMAAFAKDVPPSGFQVATLPGHSGMIGGGSYWTVDNASATALINRMILGLIPAPAPTDTTLVEPTVGILYSKTHQADLEAWKALFAEAGVKVSCQSRERQRPTQFIVHNMAMRTEDFDKIRHISPAFANLQLIFAPIGSTFETNSCGNTDYTIVLGENTRSLSDQ